MEEARFLRHKFQEYYETKFKDLDFPPNLERREFGFLFWDNPTFQRHKGFIDFESLRHSLIQDGPKHAFISAAQYEIPDAPKMHKKYWMGCDLIFDIDADHIPSKCKWEHDSFVCKNCGFSGKGPPPKTCKCGVANFNEKNWVCDTCLELARDETIKIIEDFLIPDFCIDKKEIKVKFSGHRGYHVQVYSSEFFKLDPDARRELIDYMTGNGIDFKVHGLYEGGNKIVHGPNLGEKGWRRRITNYAFKFIEQLTQDNLKLYKTLSTPLKKKLIENKSIILEHLTSTPANWNVVPGILINHWEYILELGIEKYTPKLDVPVSIDVHRLIRLDHSLHGKTGLEAVPIPLNKLNDYDPLKDAVVFKGEIELMMNKCPEFRLGDTLYGPYSGGTKEKLSLAAGIFALCKKVAALVKE